jgi:hypothetical protein
MTPYGGICHIPNNKKEWYIEEMPPQPFLGECTRLFSRPFYFFYISHCGFFLFPQQPTGPTWQAQEPAGRFLFFMDEGHPTEFVKGVLQAPKPYPRRGKT